jgi:hypothetical protein
MALNTRAWIWSVVAINSIGLLIAPACEQTPVNHANESSIAQAVSTTTFSGEATVVQATVPLLSPTPIVLGDTGPLPSTGGAQDATLLDVTVPQLLTAEAIHAATVGQGDRSRAEASIAAVNLTVAGNTIAADFLTARALALCTPGGPAVSGSSELVTLTVNNQSVTVAGTPNQTVPLPAGGSIIINEQKSANSGTIDVNALHVIVPGIAEVVVASAHADIACPTPPDGASCQTVQDFVTGGGWIRTPSGAKANFGVGGGIKNGALWGHLTYVDHGNAMKVKGTGVTAYLITGPRSRHIEGTAEINGQTGFSYKVDVADNGHPGHGSDTFVISLSNGYTAGNTLGGGKIKLHHRCTSSSGSTTTCSGDDFGEDHEG